MANATMTRSKEQPIEVEDQELKNLGTFNWQDVGELDPQPVGVRLSRLDKNMWSKSGYKSEKEEPKYGRKYTLVYDKQYVLDFIHSRVLVPLGISQDGEFNEELFQEIFDAAKEYSLAEEERQAEKELLRMATPLMLEKGWSKEKAIKVVQKQKEALEKVLREAEQDDE